MPKIDEIRNIMIETNPAVFGLTESKLDASVRDGEIEINGYSIARSDRNRHGGGIVCYIRSDIGYKILKRIQKYTNRANFTKHQTNPCRYPLQSSE